MSFISVRHHRPGCFTGYLFFHFHVYFPHRLIGRLLITLAVAFALSACGGAEERQEKYIQRAQKLYKSGNLTKAEIELKNALQISPKNADARHLLGVIQLSRNDVKSAFGNFRATLEEDPEHVQAHIEMAKIYIAAKEPEKAREHVNQALTREAENPVANTLLASVEISANKPSQARSILDAVLTKSPGDPGAVAVLTSMLVNETPDDALTLIDSAIGIHPENNSLKRLKIEVLKKMGRNEDIVAIYRELIDRMPNEVYFYSQLANVQIQLQKHDDAESTLREAIKNNPENSVAVFNLVNFLDRTRDSSAMENELKALIADHPALYELKEILARLYITNQRDSEAMAVFNQIIKKDAKSTDALRARISLARLYLSDNNRDKALTLLQDVFVIEPNNIDALIISARMKLADKQIKEAIGDLRAALKSDGDSLEALKLIAQAQEIDNTPSLALDSYLRAIKLAPNDTGLLINAVRLLIQDEQLEQAKKLLKQIIRVDYDNLEAYSLLTQIYLKEKNWDDALALITPLLESGHSDIEASGYTLKANIFRAQNDWVRAKAFYKEALDLSPTTFEPMAGMVDAYIHEQNLSEAIELLQTYIRTYPELPYPHELLGRIYLLKKDFKKALTEYEKLIEMTPDIEKHYHNLALLHLASGDKLAAEKTYQRAITHNNSFSAVRIYLGNFYELQGRYDDSKRLYEEAYQLNPSLDVARNNLAMILVNHFPSNENFQRALDLSSVFSKSRNPNFLDTLGWTHYHLEQFPQAISYLEAATELNRNPEYFYHLGMAYYKSGQSARARESLLIATSEAQSGSLWVEPAKIIIGTLDTLITRE